MAAEGTPTGPLLVWGVLAALAVGATAAMAYRLTRHEGRQGLYLAAPPVFMAAGAFLYVLLAETQWGRYGVIALAAILVLTYFDNLRSAVAADAGSQTDLTHLAALVDLVGFYFMAAFAFGIRQYYGVPVVLLAAVMAAAAAFVAFGAFRRGGVEPDRHRAIVGFVALFSAELHVVLTFLPVSHLVDAAVITVLLAALLQVSRQVLTGSATVHLRREFAFALALAAVLLLTARWL